VLEEDPWQLSSHHLLVWEATVRRSTRVHFEQSVATISPAVVSTAASLNIAKRACLDATLDQAAILAPS